MKNRRKKPRFIIVRDRVHLACFDNFFKRIISDRKFRNANGAHVPTNYPLKNKKNKKNK